MVSFTESIRICLVDKILNWRDRAPRSEYWWFTLFFYIALCLLSLLAMTSNIVAIIACLGFAYLFFANIMVTIRRLHDKNKSGLLLLLNYVLLIASTAASVGEREPNAVSGLLGLVSFVFGIYLFVLYVTEGTIGNNRFGPDPLAQDRLNAASKIFQNQGFAPNTPPQGFNPNYNPNANPNYGQQQPLTNNQQNSQSNIANQDAQFK